jgi:uncharacterized membrane protein (Fun14 family)
MTAESLYPIAGTLGGTFLGAFLIGFFIKKIIKILMFVFWWDFGPVNVFAISRNDKCRS